MNVETTERTFEQIASDEVGTRYLDVYENGVRCIVLRGPGALCAYMGIPADHPLAGFDYDDIPTVEAHGGLTYGKEGNGEYLPSGWYWYGWDYAHAGDKCFYALGDDRYSIRDEKAWTVADVQKELWGATYDFAKVIALAESIARRRGAA